MEILQIVTDSVLFVLLIYFVDLYIVTSVALTGLPQRRVLV